MPCDVGFKRRLRSDPKSDSSMGCACPGGRFDSHDPQDDIEARPRVHADSASGRMQEGARLHPRFLHSALEAGPRYSLGCWIARLCYGFPDIRSHGDAIRGGDEIMSESEALPVEQWLGWDSKVPHNDWSRSDIACFFDWVDDNRIIASWYCQDAHNSWVQTSTKPLTIPIEINRPRKKNQKISTNKRWKGGTEK